jgi:hypothetical protein
MKPIIQHGFSRRWLGLGALLIAALAARASTDVTFSIDMASVSPAPTSVYISGSFNGWPGFSGGAGSPAAALVNITGTVWSNTITIADASGSVESCKFQYEAGDNWESINNRQFILDSTPQVLPLTTWNANTTWPPAPTNHTTFRVDMTTQILLGAFTPGAGTIRVSGDFEGWNDGLDMTNNPTLSGSTSNIYSGIFDVVGFPPTGINYKFRMNGGWENPASTGGNNRQASVSGDQVLPLVFYDDTISNDLLKQPTPVSFIIDMNGAVGQNVDTHVFDPALDSVYINGQFANWYAWAGGITPQPAPAGYQLFETPPGSGIYSNTIIIPAGTPVSFNYKYGIDANNANGGPADDEAGFGTNHFRVVRSTAFNPYPMPMDKFSNMYAEPFFSATSTGGGNLSAGAVAAGKVPVTWLGRPGAHLQVKDNLSGGVWQDIPATDGTNWNIGYSSTNGFVSQTNWPANSTNKFFRLVKP